MGAHAVEGQGGLRQRDPAQQGGEVEVVPAEGVRNRSYISIPSNHNDQVAFLVQGLGPSLHG